MPDPTAYFSDDKAKSLASDVWQLAATKKNFYSTVCEVNAFRFQSPDARRTLHAKDWITYWRQDGEPDNNAALCKELGRAADFYSAVHIADVEHFFVAAFMGVAIGPTLTQGGSVAWETLDILIKKPVMDAVKAHELGEDKVKAFFNGFPGGLDGWLESIKWNYGHQLAGSNQAGLAFASELVEGMPTTPWDHSASGIARIATDIKKAYDFISRELSTAPPAPPSSTDPPAAAPPPSVAPPSPQDRTFQLDFSNPDKRSLSAIASSVYNTWELWPLIWWNNPEIKNPNRLQGMKTVKYKLFASYPAEVITKARAASPSWKQFPL